MRDIIARDGVASPALPALSVRPLSQAVGAEITGIDLSEPLDDATVAAIRAALLEHLVVFFRDQHLDDEQHLAFAQRFGPLSISPLGFTWSRTVTDGESWYFVATGEMLSGPKRCANARCCSSSRC